MNKLCLRGESFDQGLSRRFEEVEPRNRHIYAELSGKQGRNMVYLGVTQKQQSPGG